MTQQDQRELTNTLQLTCLSFNFLYYEQQGAAQAYRTDVVAPSFKRAVEAFLAAHPDAFIYSVRELRGTGDPSDIIVVTDPAEATA